MFLHSLFFVLAVAPPIPTPLLPSECPEPNRAVTLENAAAAVYPESARSLGIGAVTVLVNVTVGPEGSPLNATIYKSSGNEAIDHASLLAARQSTYEPKIVNCAPTLGEYTFRATFEPGEHAAPTLSAAPFPAPTFHPPSDWLAVENLPPQSANRWVYSAWQKGDAVLTLAGIPQSIALEDIQKQTITGLTSGGAKIVLNTMERICGGSADALLIAYTRIGRDKASTFVADLYSRAPHGIYQVVLYAPSAQTLDPVVDMAMKTLCVPDK